jgi:hypothetical protein
VILFPVIYDIILGMTDGINRMNTTRGILQPTVANMFTTALVLGLGLALTVSGACSLGLGRGAACTPGMGLKAACTPGAG